MSKKNTPAASIAPEDLPTTGIDTSADNLRSAPSTPAEALPQGGGRYTRTPAGDLVRVNDQPTQTVTNDHNKKEQA